MRSRPLPKIVLSTFAAGLALSACAGAPGADTAAAGGADYPVKACSCGFTSTIKAKPQRAITMNQGATEVALALGVEDQLSGTAYLRTQNRTTSNREPASAFGRSPQQESLQ